MGKSVSERLLRERGVPVVDTDRLAREIVEPGQPALEEVRRQFGEDIVDPKGHLRRDELARRVFSDRRERAKLEKILHPRIRELWMAQIAAWRSEGREFAVVVIPLLFETGAEAQFDATICVACQRRHNGNAWPSAARAWRTARAGSRLNGQSNANWPSQRTSFGRKEASKSTPPSLERILFPARQPHD